MYEVRGWVKFTEEDDWEKGCLPETGHTFGGEDTFTHGTEAGLIEKLMAFAGTDDKSAVLINACGEDGRIDICTTETTYGFGLSKFQLEQWKRGEIPKTDRFVLAWSKTDADYIHKNQPQIPGPEVTRFEKSSGKFFVGYMYVEPDFWCFLEQIYST